MATFLHSGEMSLSPWIRRLLILCVSYNMKENVDSMGRPMPPSDRQVGPTITGMYLYKVVTIDQCQADHPRCN